MTSNEIEEINVQKNIFDCINNFESFRFNSGAGSGKTYALIETIKYLIKHNIAILQKNNQQIVCVTYTNVAVKEIKERLGQSDVVIVSTIHEMLWDILKVHQPQLVECHYQKISCELDKLNSELSDKEHSKLKVFTSLSEHEKENFKVFAFKTKNIYYQNINAKSKEFKDAYKPFEELIGDSNFKSWFKNYSNFQEVVKRLYKQRRYQYCKEQIDNENDEYQNVMYDSTANTDRLDRMKFSHDTLLEYSKNLVEQYPMLRRIIIDKYPYIFVDEYQDTSEEVVELIRYLDVFSLEQKKKWLVGYFGDTAQNIYGAGVGTKISTLHPNVTMIDKRFNRRSHLGIIQTINKIRNDNISQIKFYEDRNNGAVEFHHINANRDENKQVAFTHDFLKKYQALLNIDSSTGNKKINCLVLTNKLMAQLNGFGEIYDAFKGADNIYYKDLNTKLLSNDLEKLDPLIRLLYRFVQQFMKINSSKTTYYGVFGRHSGKLSFSAANKLINNINAKEPKTLGDLIKVISDLYNADVKSNELVAYCKQCLKNKKEDVENFGTIESMIKSLLRELMIIIRVPNDDKSATDLTDDQKNKLADEEVERVDSVLNIPLNIWEQWVNFINQDLVGDIIFHTYHGTKGEEYENVAIIMEHSFGRAYEGKNKFKKYFEHLQYDKKVQDEKLKDDKYSDEFYNTRNLVYVACSRAIKNLKVLYLDDISDIQKGIKTVFEEQLEWKT
jgi:DNA helicase-2/ATP-dependent DNA helicase PcrA